MYGSGWERGDRDAGWGLPYGADATAPVLVGLDGSLGGERALAWALAEAVAQGAPVRALTVWAWDARLLSSVGGRSSHGVERLHQRQEEQISRVLRQVGWPHVQIDTDVVEGDPASVLLEASQTARLLVVGSHGEPGRTAMGSVARACIRSAGCPVVVVPVRATA